MKCHDDHHHYSLYPFELSKDSPAATQELKFIKKEQDPNASVGILRTVHNGTTNEEVLKVLIHRLQGLNAKFPCKENAVALTHIETALLWLEKRTADRISRGVEGRNIP